MHACAICTIYISVQLTTDFLLLSSLCKGWLVSKGARMYKKPYQNSPWGSLGFNNVNPTYAIFLYDGPM